MHYISATRKKSCSACVKSRRRCDLEYPFCRRCLVKGLDCTYPSPSSVRDRKMVVRQTPPDLTPGKASVEVVDSSAELLPFNSASTDPLGHDGLPFSCASGSSSSSSLGSWQDEFAVSASLLLDNVPFEEPQLRRALWPEVTAPAYLNEGQVRYILQALRSYVPSMAYTGSTPFLHQNLWQRYQPESYQDCVSISALYLCKTSANTSLITNSINAKIARLGAASGNWSLLEHLAAVQTLIIYQIIRLFDPSLNDQAQAQKHNILLEIWAAHLWKRSFNEPTFLVNCYETWVFNESLRRTIMMSAYVRCAWSLYTRDGLADQVPVLARIPFTKDLQAWKTDPEEWNDNVLPELLEEDGLTVYMDFTNSWTHEKEVETLDPFGKLLLAACRGGDDPRLLS
ncbi:hypothetical protein BU25DRAFT_104970 [Macroventuria anomochaeta]|uniref:Uncharacterized protein n=1 Tax=Macroventuria anomochaeta TaxID=301207 RepID=A0ACB6RVE6_9PLEO|nr:uncharacterized protein BU25DRAFT_104970 [Macroventuria anomochaeta]KAF2625861.1 hypothetical protein BU25DRAFT_104970 [Macroventuria anomochaeta]